MKGESSRSVTGRLDSPIQDILVELHAELSGNRDGEVATYIPELGKANPEWFGMVLVTQDGTIYEVGDTGVEFTIQSISKPFAYGMALEDNGKSRVLEKIWMEPSGEAFNAISLREGTGQPANPMINAGAIATTSLVEGRSTDQKIHRILDSLGRYAGRPLKIDRDVYRSESATGHRNRAIAYMLRNFDIIDEDPIPSLEAYFMQCSIAVTCRDLAVMGATLANGGVNPLTGDRALVADYVESILSVMGSCGMYDAAGEWVYNVGMPAKSGVAGGIVAVLPGQLGIGVFSPRLDSHGNSVRGIELCRELSRMFNLHMFHIPRMSASTLRQSSTLANTTSKRLRTEGQNRVIRERGGRVRIVELQGELLFSSAEVALREMMRDAGRLDVLILDLNHVQAVGYTACEVMARAFRKLIGAGARVLISRCGHLPVLTRALRKQLDKGEREAMDTCDTLDLALEMAEGMLLDQAGIRHHSADGVGLAECELLQGMDAAQIEKLSGLLREQRYAAGDAVVRHGAESREMFFLLRGKASAWISSEGGDGRRLATFSPGMTFGEMALLDRAPRSASVFADSDIETLVLDVDVYDGMERTHPAIRMRIVENMTRLLSRRLREANNELAKFYG